MNEPTNPFLDAPDQTFVLTAEERAQTFVAFDPDIVEQILRWVRPEQRDSFRRTLFVDAEHQLTTEGGFYIGAERPELAHLIGQLARFENDS